ncbi:hypothetical protein JKP88DRAFT_241601 [Tribonema minus]|uniref:Uncharacterized protein n=1 Tax=Tribonema minus TaxID=303371 RepID=A0A836CEW6_9STRA|nr:hypothetical protein JKP88DRAFT_241601 [Tribonema minus]
MRSLTRSEYESESIDALRRVHRALLSSRVHALQNDTAARRSLSQGGGADMHGASAAAAGLSPAAAAAKAAAMEAEARRRALSAAAAARKRAVQELLGTAYTPADLQAAYKFMGSSSRHVPQFCQVACDAHIGQKLVPPKSEPPAETARKKQLVTAAWGPLCVLIGTVASIKAGSTCCISPAPRPARRRRTSSCRVKSQYYVAAVARTRNRRSASKVLLNQRHHQMTCSTSQLTQGRLSWAMLSVVQAARAAVGAAVAALLARAPAGGLRGATGSAFDGQLDPLEMRTQVALSFSGLRLSDAQLAALFAALSAAAPATAAGRACGHAFQRWAAAAGAAACDADRLRLRANEAARARTRLGAAAAPAPLGR